MLIAPETIHRHLSELSQRSSLNAALELFDTRGRVGAGVEHAGPTSCMG